MIRKVAPCAGCYTTTMCVSKDNATFYCNRCLPYFLRQSMYPSDSPEMKTTTRETRSIDTNNAFIQEPIKQKESRKSKK